MTGQDQIAYPRRAVVDTCVILNVALGEKDSLPSECLPRSKRLLADAIEQKELELFIPTMALIELISDHAINTQSGLTRSESRRAKRMLLDWCEQCGLPAVDLTAEAVEWFRQTSALQKLRPGDAAVLASAKYVNAEIVYTWDKRFIKVVEKANADIPLGITACPPPEIPKIMREMTLFDDLVPEPDL